VKITKKLRKIDRQP